MYKRRKLGEGEKEGGRISIRIGSRGYVVVVACTVRTPKTETGFHVFSCTFCLVDRTVSQELKPLGLFLSQ